MKIASIEVIPVSFPFRGEFKISRGTVGSEEMGRPSVLVRLTTDTGVVGWGESAPVRQWSYETIESVYTTLTRYLVPAVIGMDLFDLDGIHRAMDREIAPGYTMGQPIARAGIDLAVHDAIGKALGVPLRNLWGISRKDTVELSWTVAADNLEEVEAIVAEGRDRGYSHFNIKVGHEENPSYDVEVCRFVRLLEPTSFLWVDANGGYTVQTARRLLPRFADIGVNVIEQPLPPNAWSGYRELRRLRAVPIVMDEGVITPRDLIELIREDLIDGVAMKPARVGGLWHLRKMIEIVESAGLMFLGSGLTDPDLGFAASVQLYAAYGLRYPAALNGPQFLKGTIASAGIEVQNGRATVPDRPGLGVEVDEAKVEELRLPLQLDG